MIMAAIEYNTYLYKIMSHVLIHAVIPNCGLLQAQLVLDAMPR